MSFCVVGKAPKWIVRSMHRTLKEGVTTVSHGGISVEEVIVPVVRIRRSG